MSVYIFLGPSLPLDQARQELGEAVFLPPVRRGDVYRLVADGRPLVIGIVDGLFDTVPAVVHKEILFAISRGVRVLGAASMGALRAAELWQFGMEGVGRVFEQYRSGKWDADDEVAVVHGGAEVGHQATSVALATIRFALAEAQNRNIISPAAVDDLISAAKDQFYAHRSWRSLHEIGQLSGLDPEELSAFRAYVADECPDAKRDDALALLRRIRELLADGAAPPPHDFDFETTVYWERLTAEAGSLVDVRRADPVRQDSAPVTNSDLFRHVQVRPNGPDRVRATALLHLLDHYATTMNLAPSEQEQKESLAKFRRRRGLLSAVQTRRWLAEQHITEDELRSLIRLELALEAVLARSDQAVRSLLPLELKRRGEFTQAVRAITRKKQVIEQLDVRSLTLADAGVGFADLLDWYQATRQSLHGSIKEHADHLGFDSPRELFSEILLEYVTERGSETDIG
ncbi:MAG: TfuA-like protein [Kibdelosporangium sp.]